MKRCIISLIILLLPLITLGMDNQKRKFLQNQDLEFENITLELNKRYQEDNAEEQNVRSQQYKEPIEFITYTDEYTRKLSWKRRWKKLKQFFCCCCMTNEEK